MRSFTFIRRFKLGSVSNVTAFLAAAALACFLSVPIRAQQADSKAPVVVQPGAPGQPTRVLPPATRAILPPRSAKDIEFMQGMIMHHAQAVEMTALIESRTENKETSAAGSAHQPIAI